MQAAPPRISVSRITAAISRALPRAGAVFSAAITSGSIRRSFKAPGRTHSATVRSGPARNSASSPANSASLAPGTRRPGASTHHGIRPPFGRTVQRAPDTRSQNGNCASGGPPWVCSDPMRRRKAAIVRLPESQR